MTNHYQPMPRFHYRRAMPQQEPGGKTWCVVTDVKKMPNGLITSRVYEPHLPTKTRAVRLARILNKAALGA